jgi:hypothetical protein
MLHNIGLKTLRYSSPFIIIIIFSASCSEVPATGFVELQKTETNQTEVLVTTPPVTVSILYGATKTPFPETQNDTEMPTEEMKTLTPVRTNIFTPTPQIDIVGNPTVSLCHEVPTPQIEKPEKSSSNVFISGQFSLCALEADLAAFDLDQGVIMNPNNPESDVTFKVGKATLDNHIIYYVWEVNGSKVNEPNTPNPDYSECKEVAGVSENMRWQFILGDPGNLGCVITNERRVSLIKITQIDPVGLESLEISFVTWSN